MYWIRWTLPILIGCIPNVFFAQSWDQGDQNLTTFLEERKLDRLTTRMVALEYGRTTEESKREKLASDLKERYRKLLLSNPLPVDAPKIIERAESLMRDFPGKNLPDLGLALSHAKYLIAENEFFDWWSRGAPGSERSKVLDHFDKVQTELQRWISLENLRRDNAIASLPFDKEQEPELQLELQRIQSRLVLSNYLMGWTFYFRFVIADKPDFRKLTQSHQSFYRSLQIEQNVPIDRIKTKWLDFSNVTDKRALLGLAMVYTAQDKSLAARYCFETLSKIAPEIEESTIHFNSFAFPRNWAQAYQWAKNADARATPEVWNAVLTAGYVATNNSSNTATRIEGSRLQRLGLLGLLRAFDSNSISKFVSQTGMKLKDNSVEDLWIQALLAFNIRDANLGPESLEYAAAKSREAIHIAPKGFDSVDIIRIKFLIALIEFQLERFEIALAMLPESFSEFRSTDPELVERILWLRCRCLIQLSRNDSRKVGQAIYSMNQLLSAFPTTELAARIRFEKRIATNRLLTPTNAIAELKKINLGDPFFTESLFEIVKNQFYVWEDTVGNEALERIAFQNLVEAESRYSKNARTPNQKLNSTWFILEATIRRLAPESEVNSWIDVADSLAKESGNYSIIEPQLMHYRFLAAKKFKHLNSALRIAKWLANNSGNKKSTIAALAYLADNIELANLDLSSRVDVFEKLSDHLGNSEMDLISSANSRIAASHLVENWIVCGKLAEARLLNEKLLNVSPNSQKYNLNAARIASGQKDASAALRYWNKIARGSTAGSDHWLEAKHELIRLLIESDIERANALLQQSLSLAGILEASWQKKFDQLSARITAKKNQEPQLN